MHERNPTSAACMFLLFLLLTPVSPQCRTAKADECNLHGQSVTGHEWASKGIDITTLDDTEASVFDLSEWQKSDGSCTLCENPVLQWKPLQRLPLAFAEWKANISCQEKVQHSVVPSAISVAKVMTDLLVKNDWKKELDVEVRSVANVQRALAGSMSRMVSFLKAKSTEDQYEFFFHYISCSYYKFRITNGQSASDKFKNDVVALPEKYDHSSKRAYHRLIRKYGTHFKTEFDLGARLRFLIAIATCKNMLEGILTSVYIRCMEIHMHNVFTFDHMAYNPDYQKCRGLGRLHYTEGCRSEWSWCRGGKKHSVYSNYHFITEDSKGWLESVKTQPTLLSYTLEPLHTMLDKVDPRRESLRQAVSEYVRERALWRNCTHSCPPGIRHGDWDSCSCECPNNNFTNSMCCAQESALATLTVTIERASSLWGDYITRSDAYVKVLLQTRQMRTHTVWNNNIPEWNTTLDFGVIRMATEHYDIVVEVWDEDFGWRQDFLGSCKFQMQTWESYSRVCYLDHGRLYFKYLLACHPHLAGPDCTEYRAPWKKEKKLFSQRQGISDMMKRSSP